MTQTMRAIVNTGPGRGHRDNRMQQKLLLVILLEGLTMGAWAATGMADIFQGIEGHWLTNQTAEAFVSGKPYPRIAAFRLKGGESPLRVSTSDPFTGIRIWFMEPAQNDLSPLPSQQPATVEVLTPLALRLTAEPEPKSGLQLTMEASLDPTQPVLRLRHGFKNLRPERRRLAAWSITAVPHRGVGFTPWRARNSNAISSLLFFPGHNPADPTVRIGERAVGVDFRVSPRGGQHKIGVHSDAGWTAYIWAGHVLKSSGRFFKDAEYPEGGGTVTFYQCGLSLDEGFCEIENLGPLRDVPPGETLWMEQELEIRAVGKPAYDTPDGWLEALEKASLKPVGSP